MSSTTYDRILEESQSLSAAEMEQLIQELEDRKRVLEKTPRTPQRAWKDLRGKAPYPLCGEDAQDWVSRTRRESDERRRVG